MGKPSAPEPPDPRETSAAQTGTNVSTTIANNMMGMVDQYTPYGSLTYRPRGSAGGAGASAPGAAGGMAQQMPNIVTIPGSPGVQGQSDNRLDTGPRGHGGERQERPAWESYVGGGGSPTTYQVGDQVFTDRASAERYRTNLANANSASSYTWTDEFTGNTYTVPLYESHVQLSPEQERLLRSNQAAMQNMSDMAVDRSGFLKDYFESDPDQGFEALDDKLFEMGRQRIDPRMQQRRAALHTQLANQGIAPGSEAYNREMTLLEQAESDAYNELALRGRGQALEETFARRNQPINEIIGLLSGTQIQNPNVQRESPSRLPIVDNAGIIQDDFNNRMGIYNAKASQSQALLGGLFGLAGRVIGA